MRPWYVLHCDRIGTSVALPAGENCDEVTNLVSCDTSVLYPVAAKAARRSASGGAPSGHRDVQFLWDYLRALLGGGQVDSGFANVGSAGSRRHSRRGV